MIRGAAKGRGAVKVALRVSQQALLTALGVPPTMSLYRPRVDGDDLIGRSLRELGTRLVIFDETLHMGNLRGRLLALQWDWIKWVSTANRVSVVCTGIPGFEQTIRDEAQLETRFNIMRMPRWSIGPTFEQFLTSFEQSLPLRRPSGLGAARMQGAILRESGLKQQIAGITQGIKQVIEHAAIEAIRTGEVTGKMAQVLLELNKQIRDSRDTKRKVKGALMYPMILISVAVIAVTVMLWLVVPTFAKMFEDMDAKLPAITQFVVDTSNYIVKYGVYGVIAIVALIFGFKKFMKTEAGRKYVGGAMMVMVVTIGGFGPPTRGRSLEEISR